MVRLAMSEGEAREYASEAEVQKHNKPKASYAEPRSSKRAREEEEFETRARKR